jgi:glycosyltransferase involved in cell wall biosynthesis
VATRDRHDDLRNCLSCLAAQKSPRQTEIIVVDRNPSSGLTAPVVAEFSNVVLVNELRMELAHAINKGFIMRKGNIFITLPITM